MVTITTSTDIAVQAPTIKCSYPPKDWLASMRPEAEIKENLRRVAVQTMFRNEPAAWGRWLERIELPRWAVRWEVGK